MTDTGPTTLPDVIVVGSRAVPGAPMGTGGGIPEPGGHTIHQAGDAPEPSTVYTVEAAEAENRRQKECAAEAFKAGMNGKSNSDKKEYFSYTWNRNGETATHPVRGGSGDIIQPSDRAAVRTEFGIANADVIAFNHNHPADVYCPNRGLIGQDELLENAYPSDNDWNFAQDAVLNRGVPNTLILYVADCEGNLRGFDYLSMQEWKAAKTRRDPPPAPISPDCSE